ncbi:MAG: hypothetical protein IT537_08550 [Hyphomicrobiales bacterium]|nr:hypothetical protein [Hyphomicrobiales bacterium]
MPATHDPAGKQDQTAHTSAPVVAYKAFNADWSCQGFRYEIGKTYEHTGEVVLCGSGFHACTVPFDCWNYYPHSLALAKVTLTGVSDHRDGDSKIVAAKITIEASLSLPQWIMAHVDTVLDLCRAAKGALVGGKEECAAATGDRGHAAATGYGGHAAATGYGGHAAATGYSGHAAATGYGGHAAATGDRGHAAAIGYRGHAAATGDRGHAAATGYGGHAAATGYSGHAAVKGKNSIAVAIGPNGTARAEAGGAIMLAAYDDEWNLAAVFSSKVGENGVEPGVTYRLGVDGNLQVVGGES